MNKKVLALLLVTAMAVQVKAAGSDEEKDGFHTPTAQQEQNNSGVSTPVNSDSDESGDDLDNANPVDVASGVGHSNRPISPIQASQISSERNNNAPQPKLEPKKVTRRPQAPKASNSSTSHAGAAAPAVASGAAPQPFFQPVPDVIPGARDNVAIAVLKRVRNKVWTAAVKGDATCDDKQMLEDILEDGAKNFHRLSASQKATYYNAQDAQYGLKTTRFFKAAKLLIAAGLFKVVRDVIKEDADEDDEDEA